LDRRAEERGVGVAGTDLQKDLPFLGALLKREQDMLAVAEGFGVGRRSRA
jgi:hypothetical protein